MDCFHIVNPLSASSLHEDVKILAPKHYEYLIKLPENNRCLKMIITSVWKTAAALCFWNTSILILNVSCWNKTLHVCFASLLKYLATMAACFWWLYLKIVHLFDTQD